MKRRHIDAGGIAWALAALPLVLVLAAMVPRAAYPDSVPHITLDASAPEDEQVVEGDVTEVRLFFSGAPLMRGASVRIVNSSRRLQRSTPPKADPDDPKQVAVQLDPPLPPGSYVVQWRCIADDGHVMRGDFTFEVAGG
jgi:methionine-rich copper-binding protein CopC